MHKKKVNFDQFWVIFLVYKSFFICISSKF